ncbi:LOW QUALITY PROTEIN: hypothetical protein V1477_003033, partial [Vespula maculifrons]
MSLRRNKIVGRLRQTRRYGNRAIFLGEKSGLDVFGNVYRGNDGDRKIGWIVLDVVNEDGVNDPLYFHVNCHPLTNRDSLNSLELFRTSLRLSKLIGDQTRRLSVNLQGATKTSRNVEESAFYFTSDVHCLDVDEKRMRTTR